MRIASKRSAMESTRALLSRSSSLPSEFDRRCSLSETKFLGWVYLLFTSSSHLGKQVRKSVEQNHKKNRQLIGKAWNSDYLGSRSCMAMFGHCTKSGRSHSERKSRWKWKMIFAKQQKWKKCLATTTNQRESLNRAEWSQCCCLRRTGKLHWLARWGHSRNLLCRTFFCSLSSCFRTT